MAKSYSNKEEMGSISKGHREGKYIIIDKIGNRYKCLYCSNKNNKKIISYKIDHYKYKLNSDAYAYFDKMHTLSKKRIIKKLGNLDIKDLNNLYKYLFVMNKNFLLNMDVNNIDYNFDYNIGDIVLDYNQMIYIYDKDNSYFYGYIAHRVKENQNGVIINGDKYSLLTKTTRKIPGNSNIQLLDIARLSDLKGINNYIKKEKAIIHSNNILNRGKLIKYNNNIYYIYAENKDNLLIYKVYIINHNKEGMVKIKINDEFYYTLFEEKKLVGIKG